MVSTPGISMSTPRPNCLPTSCNSPGASFVEMSANVVLHERANAVSNGTVPIPKPA